MLMGTGIIWKSSHVHWLRKRRDCLCLCGHGSNWKYRNNLLGNCRCIANGTITTRQRVRPSQFQNSFFNRVGVQVAV